MLLTSVLIVGGVLFGSAKLGSKLYVNYKRKKETVKTLSANKIRNQIFQSGKTRRQQMQEVTVGEHEITEEEKKIKRSLVITSINLALAGTSLIYPTLIWLTVPGLIYACIPFYKLAYHSLVKEHRVSSYVLDAILALGMLLGGYFYAAVIDIWFITLGRLLLLKSENNSKTNLKNLFGEQPRSVWILLDGVEIQIPFETLQVGDIIVINAGQMIPVDGVIMTGFAAIDQHRLTGEAQPVEKSVGDPVLASTTVLAGKIHVQTEKAGPETVAMQIGSILEHTADFKNSIQSRGEAIADKLTLPTMGIAAIFLPILGLSSALAVLTNTFGYKMRVFAPASMLTFLNIASLQGILIKDGRSLELLNDIDTVVFDKTGTLTLEQPTVKKIYTCNGICEDELLRYAATAEYGQTHPIAKAILTAANERQLQKLEIDNAKYQIGYGIEANLSGKVIQVGSNKFMEMAGIIIPSEIYQAQDSSHKHGYSLVMVALDNQLKGAIELQPTIRPEAKQIIDDLRQRNLSIYIISGDQEEPTKKLADWLGVDQYFANTLPEEKGHLVEKLQQEGRTVCFVGDGINDSIALKKANVSVSISGATTIATDTAQVILMDGSLNQLGQLFDIVQKFEINMKNNFWISTIPTATCLGGIIFFHWGVMIGIIIGGATQFTGIGNSMLPLLEQTNQNSDDN